MIGAYLEPAGAGRLKAFQRARDLYDLRSKVAHGATVAESEGAFMATRELLKECLLRMVESRKVPPIEELEGNLFDNRLWVTREET